MLKKTRKVQGNINSLYVILTDHLKELGLDKGDSVQVETIKDKIVIIRSN